MMQIQKTAIPGLLIIEPQVFGDDRGFFYESYNEKKLAEVAGITEHFVQDNHSRSQRGVLRGLHFQRTRPQGKLVSVTRGAVFDVVVDINPASPTCGQHVGVELSDVNHRQLWMPPGYAHGFCVLSAEADFIYKCTDYYDSADEGGLAWNCPRVGIDWPVRDPALSAKDGRYPNLDELLGAQR